MALKNYMHMLREAERAVTCTHLVNFLKRHERPWLNEYLANKNCGYQAFLKLLQRFCTKHDFTREKPSKAKKSQEELSASRTADSEEDVDMMTVPAQKKRLVVIDRAIKAWARITPQENRRSFAKAIPQ
ncbi:hypothetical protein DYB37_006877 [Aphanomyces astaci]|uniref:Uncharacterized protein n=1 Tax=Aphanomyces astaci TaxID=112090 RepID=A0A3R7ALC1_APHAT|nr:hypothetical protein DYB37_006877 [Aphanomyces astaci]